MTEGRSAPDAYGVDTGPLRWHYGPTDADPDPGKMWCYDCGSEVYGMDDVWGCTGCGREEPIG